MSMMAWSTAWQAALSSVHWATVSFFPSGALRPSTGFRALAAAGEAARNMAEK
jgi:hypothetical protein